MSYRIVIILGSWEAFFTFAVLDFIKLYTECNGPVDGP